MPSDAATSVGFGHSLAVQPGRLLVGGTRNAYVFEPVAGVWTETAILAGGPEPLNGVDLSGERAVLAHARAFVFEHDGSGATGWNSGTVLDDSGAATPPSGTGSIRAVALDEDRVAVMNHPHICLPGELHGYEYLPGEWRKSTISYFTGSNYAPAAMDGGRLAVSNGVELFIVRALPSGGWVEEETLTSTIPGANVPGGVDIEGHLAVHGVPFDSVAGSLLGAVRIWELSPFAGLPEAVSVLSGGKQELELRRGPDEAFALYWIFGSATGTSPGLVVDGLPFPLNFDAYYQFLALNPNTLVNPTIGILDGHGHAPSHIEFPPIDPTLVGVTLHHAYLTIELSGQPFVDFTSNAVPLRFATESDLSPQDFEATVDGWDFGPAGADWQIVEDGQCGAVSRMAAYTSAAPNCGGDLTSPIANARLTSAPFRLGQVGDYELHLKSILTPGLQGRIRLFVNGAESAYFEVAWPYDFAGTGALESLSFRVPGSEAAIGDEAYFEFVLNGTPSGSPAGWWVDDVELVKLP